MDPQIAIGIRRVIALIEREASLREAARIEEIVPDARHRAEAARLIELAEFVRWERLAELEAMGLSRRDR